jgi:CheY-like chemotaxis protein
MEGPADADIRGVASARKTARAQVRCDEPFRIAVLDDSPVSTKLQQKLIRDRFPNAEITVCHEPRLLLGNDVYLIDNQFGSSECAVDLATRIRANEPDSLIIVWSATVTKQLLKRLAPVGINAVAEKESREDIEAALQVIERFVRRGPRHHSFGDTIRSIRDLLAQWNTRLATEEKAASA